MHQKRSGPGGGDAEARKIAPDNRSFPTKSSDGSPSHFRFAIPAAAGAPGRCCMTKRGKAHTEAQAHRLWCPMSRFGGDDGSANRWSIFNDEVTTNPPECRCIAS